MGGVTCFPLGCNSPTLPLGVDISANTNRGKPTPDSHRNDTKPTTVMPMRFGCKYTAGQSSPTVSKYQEKLTKALAEQAVTCRQPRFLAFSQNIQ
jgi:hypothetical protein